VRSLAQPKDFDQWRILCRSLLAEGIRPSEVIWHSNTQISMFTADHATDNYTGRAFLRVPRKFLELARVACCHRNNEKWDLLYRILWRLAHNEPHLLEVCTDPEVCRLHDLFRAVSREAHRMKGFVRFVEIVADSRPLLVAWYKPTHLVLPLTCQFFVNRFRSNRWAILTPDQCAYWDRRKLTFGSGVPQTHAPKTDDIEKLWCTYYASTFNPNRANLKTLKSNLPKIHWSTLPESRLISPLLKQKGARHH
jgi:probable DNA metabolism protein